MAATLQEILLAPDTQPKVITDCYALIDQELSEKSGISGTAVKLAYKTVTSFAPGYLRNTVEDILRGWSASLSRTGPTSTAPVARSSAIIWPSAAMKCRRLYSR